MPFSATAWAACSAPRVAIYTELACRIHRPDYSTGRLFVPVDHATLIGHNITNAIGGMSASASPTGPYTVPLVLNGVGDVLHIVQDDAERQHQCAVDPKVQAAVSKLIAGASLAPN